MALFFQTREYLDNYWFYDELRENTVGVQIKNRIAKLFFKSLLANPAFNKMNTSRPICVWAQKLNNSACKIGSTKEIRLLNASVILASTTTRH